MPLAECACQPDVWAYDPPTTGHIPLPWWHHAQWQVAREAGYKPAVVHGPSPYPSDYGQTMDMPASMDDLTVDGAGWQEACTYLQAYAAEAGRVERSNQKISFQPNHLPRGRHSRGGKHGWRYPWELTRPEWGRFIWKESSNGSPEIVREALPVDTDVFVAKLYTDSRRLPVRDMGVVSMLALYGVVSGSACSPSSEIIPNYKAAWERQPVLIEQLRSKLDDYGDRPRMCPPSDRPDTWPFRCLPKSVAVQVKAKLVDGQLSLSEKERATTDPGAVRSSIDPPTSVQGSPKRHKSEVTTSPDSDPESAYDRQAIDNMTSRVAAAMGRVGGKPGLDSPNACIDLDAFPEFKWGDIDDFGRGVDILVSSGFDVLIECHDFRSYYEMYGRTNTEQWMQHQFVSTKGIAVDPRAIFGWSDLCATLNQAAMAVMDIIIDELRRAQSKFDIASLDTDDQRKLRDWQHARRQCNGSGDMFKVLVFFDDSSIATLAIGEWPDIVSKITTDVWKRYNVELSPEKTVRINFGEPCPESILGRAIFVHERCRRLPAVKVAHYVQCIDDLIQSRTTGRQLVRINELQSVMGRVLFSAAAGCPTVWPVFLTLISAVAAGWSSTWVRLHDKAVDILRHISWIIQNENGTALSPYVPRPVADGLPCIVTYTDASLKEDGQSGWGGWVWLHGSSTVHYFYGSWDPNLINSAEFEINSLEGKVCNMAEAIANDIGDTMQLGTRYVFQIGDSQVYFENVASAGHAKNSRLRQLHREKAEAAAKYDVISCTWAVRREYNQPADSLSNGEVEKFQAEIKELLGSHIQTLLVPTPAALSSLANLAAISPRL